MPTAPLRLARAVLLGSMFLAGCNCGDPNYTPPPPPPPPTELTAGGNAYQVVAAGSYATTGFNLHVAALGPDERLALLVANAGGGDTAVSVLATNTVGTVGARLEGPVLAARMASGAEAEIDPALAARAPLLRGHELARQRRERFLERAQAAGAVTEAPQAALQAAAAAAVNDTRSFCVYNFGTGTTSAQPATLRHLSADSLGVSHAQFWVTDATWANFQNYALAARPDLWTVLGNAYETRIMPALGTWFGQESDVDGNGQVVFLFADLGKTTSNSFAVGYFDPTDVYYGVDPTCAGTGSNHADMLYLLDPVSFATDWGAPPGSPNFGATLDVIVDVEVPATMAHELQHNVNFNTRCLADRTKCFVAPPVCTQEGPYRQQENTWINEGLSMVSEDVAGYGLNASTERSRVRQYLDTYQGWSLTCWEADAIGNYGGVHAYMRYWLDQMGTGFTRAMEDIAHYGKANVEQATGMTFEDGFAQFAAASLVSNEDTASFAMFGGYPGTISSTGDLLSSRPFNYGAYAGALPDATQPAWAPWHHYTGTCQVAGTNTIVDKLRTARVNYTAFDPLNPILSSAIRGDGWGVFVTRGTGADATIQFRPSGSVRPGVALVRYRGALPDASFDAVNCP